MANKLTLGIDVGTTSVKAGVIDSKGAIIAQFAKNYPTHRPHPTFVEQNPDDWVRLIDEAIASFDVSNIYSVGLCSQVNTHVFLDASGIPLMQAIMWQDGRASIEAAELDAQVTEQQKIQWWGAPMPIDASHAIARMAWVAKHQSAIWEKTRWVMLPKDYCLFKLTGEATTDPLSNIGLVDNNLRYIPKVLALVPGAAERMAPLVSVTQVAGHINRGPLLGKPLVSGTMDAWAGLVGAGGAKNQSTVYLSGTSEIMGISSNIVVPTPGAIVFPENDGVRLHAAPTQSGGDAKCWFAQTVNISLDDMSVMVATSQRTNATPLFLPQLEGERAPVWDADLRAAFLGVGRQTTLADMARAVYEGVAMSARFALDTLKESSTVNSSSIACGGGGFRSAGWNQIRADVLGVDLRILAAKEPGILGAATIAAIGAGDYAGFDEAYDALAVFDQIYTPDEAKHARYNTLFSIYKEAMTMNAELGKRLSNIEG
jgi:xylulokinase